MKLRTTPQRMREQDYELFPRRAESQRIKRVPHYFSVRVGPRYVRIKVDACFVPPEIVGNLHALYVQYVEWLYTVSPHSRKTFMLSHFHASHVCTQ